MTFRSFVRPLFVALSLAFATTAAAPAFADEPATKPAPAKEEKAKGDAAKAEHKKGDQKRAFEILQVAAAVNKKHALLHNTYAWMLHKNERGDEAQAVLAKFLKKDPNNAPSKDNLLRLQNRTRMTMQGFDMQWYALGLEHPPQQMGQMRRAPKGFREPPKQRGK